MGLGCLALLAGCGRESDTEHTLFSGAIAASVSDGLAPGLPVARVEGSGKPAYVALPKTRDAYAHSLADNLFWLDALSEHAAMFARLMPGTELGEERAQALRFQAVFAAQFDKVRTGAVHDHDYVDFNQEAMRLVRPFIAFKQRMADRQSSGRMRSLAWPSFFEHTAREADRYSRRLAQLNSGETAYERAEVVEFWSHLMHEHAGFIAHWLEPEERLIERAHQASRTFRAVHSQPPGAAATDDPILAAVEEVIDFKTAAERGIESGRIRSIMHPALADHMRREAVRFRDELRRAV